MNKLSWEIQNLIILNKFTNNWLQLKYILETWNLIIFVFPLFSVTKPLTMVSESSWLLSSFKEFTKQLQLKKKFSCHYLN